jgi:putative ABC transport system permease protein
MSTPDRSRAVAVAYRIVGDGYFNLLRIPLRRGRLFTVRDNGAGPRVLIVNETFVRRYFPNEDPLAQRVVIGGERDRPFEIVGVVGDTKSYAFTATQTPPTMFQPLGQACWPRMSLLAKTEGDPNSVAGAARRAIWRVDPTQPIAGTQSMEAFLEDAVSIQHFSAVFLGTMALLALLLAAVGVYGVMAYAVQERTKELGVRLALGAGVQDVIRLVMWKGFRQAAVGLTFGLAGALAVRKILQRLLSDVSATDPATLGAVCLVLMVVVLLACWWPARRAARVDPIVALRYE